jgi:diguanylate cyclase (GGDEF)-like protein
MDPAVDAPRVRVLCVDDEPAVLEALKLVLHRHYRVLCANGGAEALEILRREPDIGVIVSDMRMPGMDGAEFLRRAREVLPDSVRILLTGQSDITSASAAINQGQIFRFLLKPCPSPALIEAIDEAADQHRAALTQRSLMHRQTIELSARVGELEYLHTHDRLTGLPNRQQFVQSVDELIATVHSHGTGLFVLVLDIDRFKYLNDSMGESVGDEILKLLADRLRHPDVRAEHVARTGGDRFALAVHPFSASGDSAATLKHVVTGVLDLLNQPIRIRGQVLHLSARSGVAVFPADGGEAKALLRNAESAMKSAKSSGARMRLYTRELGSEISTRTRLEQTLSEAVESGQLQLYYQPKVDMFSGAICGAEALLRWSHPELGRVSPAQFVPLLEETGRIHEVGRQCLRQAVADVRRWTREGLAPPPVAVNIAAAQLRQADFVEQVCAEVCTPPDATQWISLEITESMLITDVEDAIAKLRLLSDRGITVAIDDFGTGYSSLAYLARLPLAAVKIDRSFVSRLKNEKDPVMTGIIALARALNLKTIAEGVETREQLVYLRQLGCHQFQGYLCSPAVPADDFAALLRRPPDWRFDG